MVPWAKKKLPRDIPMKTVKRMLKRAGAEFQRQSGNHQAWRRVIGEKVYTTTLQADDPVRKDVYESICRNLHISKDEWRQLYHDKKFELIPTQEAIPTLSD